MSFNIHPDFEKAFLSLQEDFSFVPENDLTSNNTLSVGATRDNQNLQVLSHEDTRKTYLTCLHLGIMGVPQKNGSDHHLMNLMNGEEEDFLKNPRQADILQICHIPFKIGGIAVHGASGLRISEKHFLTTAWQNAAIQSDPKIIAIFGGVDEIRAHHFLQDTHSPFLEIPDHVLQDCYKMKRPHGHYPHSTQILMNQGYAHRLRAANILTQPLVDYLNIYLPSQK